MGLDVRSKFSWFFAGVITTFCIHLIYSILNNHDVKIEPHADNTLNQSQLSNIISHPKPNPLQSSLQQHESKNVKPNSNDNASTPLALNEPADLVGPLPKFEEPEVIEDITSKYLTPNLEAFRGHKEFVRSYLYFDENEPIGEWGIDQEYKIQSQIQWTDDTSLIHVECKKSVCIMSGKTNSKASFLKLYQQYAVEGSFLDFYGNNYEIVPDGDGAFVWFWNNYD